MRGRRTALVQVVAAVLVAALTGACDFGASTNGDPPPDPPLMAVDPAGDGDPPELTEEIAVELGTAVAVFGLGCRPQSAHQRCSADGEKTYTLIGRLRAAKVTAAWMQLGRGGGRWAVHVRLASGDRSDAVRTAERAQDKGGLVVVLDAHTGDVLGSVSPNDVRGVRITRTDLHRLTAEAVVTAFVAAAQGR